MANPMYVFQISGIKIHSKKRKLVHGIQQLGGKYIGGSVYQHASTHLIVPKVLSSEKFLAACAAGKWVVTPDYVLDSVKNASWLAEGPYELAISPGTPTAFYPVRHWREKVASGSLVGAFQGWRVLLLVQEPSRRAMFKRVLKAGMAKVYHCPPSHATITHVMAKPVTENSKTHNAPCYPVSHIEQHLCGDCCVSMSINVTDDQPSHVDFSELETELREYVIKQEGRTRLFFPEFLGYLYSPHSQAAEADFGSIGCMIECGLFSEALDSIRSSLSSGLLPPLPYLVSMIDHALQWILHTMLKNNPPWLSPSNVKKYFTQVLQCPRCKSGLWPFLETAIRYCLSSKDTCHPLPGPALPTLLHFHSDLLAFVLKLFQGELHAATNGNSLLSQGTGVSQASASGSLLYATFWTVWERSTLLSPAVKQFTQLLVQASVWEQAAMEVNTDHAERDARQRLRLVGNLLDLLAVMVEFWCQQHFKLNRNLVEKNLKDLAEHIAMISQDVSPVVLVDLIGRMPFTRLRLVTTDAMFRNLCYRNGLNVGDEALSLKKMVSSYLPALGRLGGSPRRADLRGADLRGAEPQPISHSWTSQGTDSGIQGTTVSETSPGKENIPKGLNRVNAAGETLLHRACKRNQVETVLQILALPGTDVNVEDHAGWTPLHEACNHGSTACVEALLRHLPAPHLSSQVGGVSPLHDALLNGHMDIAKLLLEHTGSVLLQQSDEYGRTALDLVSVAAQREELLRSAQIGDSALDHHVSEVRNLPLLEAGCSLLTQLIISYGQEWSLLVRPQLDDKDQSLAYKLARALETHSLQMVTSGWADQRAVKLLEDAETLLGLGRGSRMVQVSQAVRECEGENTRCLMMKLEDLKDRGTALVAHL
ncbi:SMC5-SMC6 complex localization factor protein 1 [Diretmus argenteus]